MSSRISCVHQVGPCPEPRSKGHLVLGPELEGRMQMSGSDEEMYHPTARQLAVPVVRVSILMMCKTIDIPRELRVPSWCGRDPAESFLPAGYDSTIVPMKTMWDF